MFDLIFILYSSTGWLKHVKQYVFMCTYASCQPRKNWTSQGVELEGTYFTIVSHSGTLIVKQTDGWHSGLTSCTYHLYTVDTAHFVEISVYRKRRVTNDITGKFLPRNHVVFFPVEFSLLYKVGNRLPLRLNQQVFWEKMLKNHP